MSCVLKWFCIPVAFLLLEAGEERHGKEECEAEEVEEGEEEKEDLQPIFMLQGSRKRRDMMWSIR